MQPSNPPLGDWQKKDSASLLDFERNECKYCWHFFVTQRTCNVARFVSMKVKFYQHVISDIRNCFELQ